MKRRRHHNNKGTRQIKRGKTTEQLKRIAKRLGVRFSQAQQNAYSYEEDP
jgi:hypothetical protein